MTIVSTKNCALCLVNNCYFSFSFGDGLARLQSWLGLPRSGYLDNITLAAMGRGRCGVPDILLYGHTKQVVIIILLLHHAPRPATSSAPDIHQSLKSSYIQVELGHREIQERQKR